MSASVVCSSLFEPTPWNPVVILCRRICLLQVLGKPEAAERVKVTELAVALAKAGWTEEDPVYRALYREAAFRAAEAAALAKQLAALMCSGHPPQNELPEIHVIDLAAKRQRGPT